MLKQILSQIANQTYIIKDNQKRFNNYAAHLFKKRVSLPNFTKIAQVL